MGGLVASFWSPKVGARSAIQHFAAGAVIAAVASSVIPEVERIGTTGEILSGLAIGGLVMVGLKWLVLNFERKEEGKHRPPFGLAAAAAADTLIDGAIISVSFSASQQPGVLIAMALTIELFFLTLSVGAEFQKGKSNRWPGIAVTSGIAILLLVGALSTRFFLQGASDTTLAFVLAFGAAALIYLIAEELLVENIQAEESLFSTAMLFAGFLVLIALKLISSNR